MRLLDSVLKGAFENGRLAVIDTEGRHYSYGGAGPGPHVTIRFTDPAAPRRILLNPELGAAEAYMDGAMLVEEGSVHDLMRLFFLNKRQFDMTPGQRFWRGVHRRLRRFQQNNVIARARQNARAHYDIGDEVYRTFLDRDMQYSCGYFREPGLPLDAAQLAKKRHIAAKLGIRDGQRVLDIGCGWGGLALYLAHLADVEVLGVTLSERQHRLAVARAERLGVADRVRFERRDYREVEGGFDRVVSVGMLEHVGAHFLPAYFRIVHDRLRAGGLALIHAIGTRAAPGATSPFLRRYIFPGGYAPSLSESVAAVERSGLWTLDCEIWRSHYGLTLRAWRHRFAERRAKVAARMGERFCRMWELYLSGCECAFLEGPSMVFQLQLGRERDAAPLVRDYVMEETKRIARADAAFADRVAATAWECLDGAPLPATMRQSRAAGAGLGGAAGV
ncbi:cyclopropane-fatty-acyl-phospholipid synthase [Paralimibaculum aggregatum]|uniref:Cyclopropane-fatty-acyl-phospholipid synthase n=1 Tax=Paralimibaculum aggregatum TaxID=3036245 RepID=A0ABQ6LPS3_9RHOB|nr:cyclopropane-fatty-acyl-phospholipid synthase family protein [Limibaculum sp. NKW23]GMG82928.1 cyclopropane-fatty-acyl-phospholipid synthase [Limibaculum sp. NKW23]